MKLLFGDLNENNIDDRKAILDYYNEEPIKLLEFNPGKEVLVEYSKRLS